jgi:hypothetical protein
MKQTLFEMLVWCAGSNPTLLDKCPRSEHIKHAGFGALVLIPAVLALFTMTYAISTITDHWYFYVPAGICWAGIIFFADRFLVSSFRKANNLRLPGVAQRRVEMLNLRHDVFSFSFLTRLMLSVFIGIAIAHPFVLLYFEKDIEQIIHSNKTIAEKTIRNEYSQQGAALGSSVVQQEDYVKCLRKLLIYEQSDVKINTECGSTSGMAGYQKRAATIHEQLRQAEMELASLYRRDSLNRAAAENLQQLELEKYRQTFSNGYIARENALVQLENMAGSNARTVKYFLIIFLVIIDTLAITWKALARRGPYDDHLAVIEDDVIVETQIHLMENQQTLSEKAKSIFSLRPSG